MVNKHYGYFTPANLDIFLSRGLRTKLCCGPCLIEVRVGSSDIQKFFHLTVDGSWLICASWSLLLMSDSSSPPPTATTVQSVSTDFPAPAASSSVIQTQ